MKICQQTVFQISNILLLEDTLRSTAHCTTSQSFNLAPGVYPILNTIHIKRDNLKIIGDSINPHTVVITGDKMASDAIVGNVIKISGKNVSIDGITLENSKFHLIQVAGEKGAQAPTIKNSILRNSYQQLMKVTYGKKLENRVRNGLVENCLFEYTAGIGPNWYIGGIDAHGGIDWVVKSNLFKNIASPINREAEHAIHFWNQSENNTVLNNIIINSDRSIGFGLGKKKGNLGGIIQNNIIIHNKPSHPFADVGIAIESSPDTIIVKNLIAMRNYYPNAIEYRFRDTKDAHIKENLTTKRIRKRNGANAALENNKQFPYSELIKFIKDKNLELPLFIHEALIEVLADSSSNKLK